MNPLLMMYSLGIMNGKKNTGAKLSLYQKYKLYKQLKNVAAQNTPVQSFTFDDMIYSIETPTLKLNVINIDFSQDYDSGESGYKLTLTSDGKTQHIPQNYQNDGMFAGFVFDMLDNAYNQAKKYKINLLNSKVK